MNLSVNNCRGQCYDGASNMSGCKNGVAKKISDENKAVYTHCYGHALNLAVGDTVKQSKIMRDALDTTYEMSKLVKFSPKRDSLFEKLKQELAPDTPGFRTLCPTRWTVRAVFWIIMKCFKISGKSRIPRSGTLTSERELRVSTHR